MVTIIDYGLGNLVSIQNMLKKLAVPSIISGDKNEIEKAQKIILPGVGAFDNGMKQIREKNLLDVLNKKALVEKIPVLGICLGMQLLSNKSEEGVEPGLGWIDAEARKFSFSDYTLKVPHMGWSYVNVKKENPLVPMDEKHRFYFVHSFYVQCNNPLDTIATCNYGTDFTCILNHENIFGAQFHPEKSLKFGMAFLKNFAAL
jgi:glutamine amidotransferase